jgi:hypothetical protein
MRDMPSAAGRLLGVAERIKFWLRALVAGVDPVDMLARFVAIAVLLLGVAGVAVKLVFHLPWLLVVVILLGIALGVLAEGTYREKCRLADDRAAQLKTARQDHIATLASQQAQHHLALEAQQQALKENAASALQAQREDYEQKLAEAKVLAAVNPAEWKPHYNESGEFPDSKALTFGYDHIFDHRDAYMTLGQIRCTVTDPAAITTDTTGFGRYYQYPQQFEEAPPVRPGLYRFRFEGRLKSGEWADITSGEYEVQQPPKTGLEVAIDRQIPTPFPGVGLILEIEFRVTNHDRMEHSLFPSMQGGSPFYFGPHGANDGAEHIRLQHAFGMISERRRGDELPKSVRPGETVRGVYVIEFDWDPVHKLPDYTLIISDGARRFTARPAYADDTAAVG